MPAWDKAVTIARLAPRKPREVVGRIANAIERQWDQFYSKPGSYTPVPLAQVLFELADVTGKEFPQSELADVDREVARRIAELPDDQPIAFEHNAGPALARCAYLLCRALHPNSVVETGVAYGVTTSYLLHALEKNGAGRLSSVDLPPLGDEEGRWVGALVPRELAVRWSLHRGSSRDSLPKVLSEQGPIDIFIHDSLHTFRTMSWEFECAWRHLREGGILLSDDIGFNKAFGRFVERVRPEYSAAFADDSGCYGVAVKG